jgi:hypothetical protein
LALGGSIGQSRSLLRTGTASLESCKGSYKQAFPNIEYVASAIVVAWKGVSETSNCKFDPNTTIGSDQPGYKQCIQSAIEGALGVLFNREEMGCYREKHYRSRGGLDASLRPEPPNTEASPICRSLASNLRLCRRILLAGIDAGADWQLAA